ncbi:MAG: cupin domain-containing protein [Labilithrix sp.]|nr:cupin domain-containing protein [Labilithrix sp.]MCW5835787.1 cupin domain-containing protein [Labilithrix sp.]
MSKAEATHDTSVVKLDSAWSPRGPMGEKYLASGVRVSMRLWEAEPVTTESEARAGESERDYEVVGYVVSGRAMLHVEGQAVRLDPGTSYVVPRGARHYYHVLEPLTAIEATSPPAQVHGRDAPSSQARPDDPSRAEKL